MKIKKTNNKGWNLNGGLFFTISLSLLLLNSCGGNKEKFDASGTFEAVEVIVSAEVSGRILLFDIREGQLIEAGQPAGVIDSTQPYLRKKQLEASIAALGSRRMDVSKQLGAARQQIASARHELQRFENLLQANAATQKQVDDLRAQVALLEKQLAAQQSTLNQTNESIDREAEALRLQVSQLEDQLDKCLIRSPGAGTVLVKYAQAGELAVPGKALFKMADTKQMFLRAYVTSSQLTRLQIGQKVQVLADFGEEETRPYEGTITWISEKSEFTPRTIQAREERDNLVYAIKVAVENDGYLKIGMYGNLVIGE